MLVTWKSKPSQFCIFSIFFNFYSATQQHKGVLENTQDWLRGSKYISPSLKERKEIFLVDLNTYPRNILIRCSIIFQTFMGFSTISNQTDDNVPQINHFALGADQPIFGNVPIQLFYQISQKLYIIKTLPLIDIVHHFHCKPQCTHKFSLLSMIDREGD